MKSNRNRKRSSASRNAARRQKELIVVKPTEENLTIEVKSTFTEEVLAPIARMLGHTLSSAFAYGLWCAVEILVAKLLAPLFQLGTHHQVELFEMGETCMFYAGFAIWVVTFIVGAIRMVLAETKLFGKK